MVCKWSHFVCSLSISTPLTEFFTEKKILIWVKFNLPLFLLLSSLRTLSLVFDLKGFLFLFFKKFISSVQFSYSVVSDSVTPWTAARQASLSIIDWWSLLRFMSIESVMPSNHLILCHPLLLLPSIFPSIRVFCKESVLHIRWPKYWSFISPSNDYSGLISFRMDWLDLLVV